MAQSPSSLVSEAETPQVAKALALVKGADTLVRAGDSDLALWNYRQAFDIYEMLSADHPDKWRGLAFCHSRIANMLAGAGDREGAVIACRAALAIAEKFAALNPENADWQRDLGGYHQRIGDLLAADGDRGGARSAYRASLTIAEELAALNSENADWQRDLWNDVEKIGDALTAGGDREGALAAYRLGLAIAEKLAALEPVNAVRQRNVFFSRAKVDATLAGGGGVELQSSDLVSPETVYTGEAPSPEAAVTPQLPMGETKIIQAAAELLAKVYPARAVRKALADLAAGAAHETTARAKAKRRLKWEKDARPGENPAEFAWRAYQAEAKAGELHRGLIGREDKLLRRDLNNWLRTHPMPEGIDIPTYPEWNTRRLAGTASPPRAVRVLTEEGRLHEAARYRARKAALTRT
jgi:tetratricopeptide (TPR) repeat protein